MKKGLSTVVTTLIIILLVLIAIGIVWIIIANLVNEGSEQIFLDKFTTNLNIKNVAVDNLTNSVNINVKRNVGKGDLKGIKFIFNDGQNSEVVENFTTINELEEKKFHFILNDLNIEDIQTISIAPVYKSKSGKEIYSNVIDTYLFSDIEFINTNNDQEGLIFYESFDTLESINQNNGTYSGISIEEGKFGNAIRINDSDTLSFPTRGNMVLEKGAIEFWFKPSWEGNDTRRYQFFNWKKDFAEFRIFKYYGTQSYFVFRIDDADDDWAELSTISDEPNIVGEWKPNEWHHFMASWDFESEDENMFFALDKNYILLRSFNGTFDGMPSLFEIGHMAGNRQAESLIDELKIYNYSKLSRLNEPEFLMGFTCGNEIWEEYETSDNCPGDISQLNESISPDEDYLFFEKPAFEKVFEGTIPDEGGITDIFNFRIAKNKFEPLFFNIYSREDLGRTVVSYSDFIGSEGTIPKEDAKIRVVKNWFQSGVGPTKTFFPTYTPELLISDDTLNFEGNNYSYMNLPSFPKQDYAVSDIPANTSRQFLIILKIQNSTSAGNYTSTITVAPNNFPEKTFDINIEILPFSLEESSKDNMIYYQGKISFEDSQDHVSTNRFEKQIQDIVDHGFNSATLYPEEALNYYEQKLVFMKNAGIKNLAVFMSNSDELKNLSEQYGYEPYFYGVDTPNNDADLILHIQRSIDIHNLGGRVITSVTKTTADRLKNPGDPIYLNFPGGTYEPLDYSNLAINSANVRTYLQSLISGQGIKEDNETYYWQIMQEDPKINRFLSGFYLYLTGLNGIFPYVYQGVINNPYDDFDEWYSTLRDHLATYPSQEGPITTMQWEALREGIDDNRYLEKWNKTKEQVKLINSSIAQESENRINNTLDKYKDYNNGLSLSVSQFNEDRETVKDEIIFLMQYLP
ncbi:MAG: hypothetical protein PVJ67_06105 [Candidatus Pacearchaeota archaeon]|jgi:hypothetical protein